MENINVIYEPHVNTRHQVLAKYSTTLKQLRSLAENCHEIRPIAFDNFVLFQYFKHCNKKTLSRQPMVSREATGYLNFSPMTFLKNELINHILDRKRQILYWLFYLLVAVFCILAYSHEKSASVAGRSVRSIFYPSMRMWRRMTLPLIERFPRLTELYDESCLLENPFFQDNEKSCYCSHVESVVDLTSAIRNGEAEIGVYKNSGTDNLKHEMILSEYVPFILKIQQGPIELQDIYNLFVNNQDIFKRDAYRVYSTNRDVVNLKDLFNEFNQTNKMQTHNLWRCNRMSPARLLRKLFVRSPTLPSNLALERFVAIDTPQVQSYILPDTECPHVYIQQALGTRYIILRPTSECGNRCRTLSMRLPQSFLLSYNSWYWKPISAPDPMSDSLSISLIGSYC